MVPQNLFSAPQNFRGREVGRIGKPLPLYSHQKISSIPFPHGYLVQPGHFVYSLIQVLLSTYYVSSTVLGLRITNENKTNTALPP